MKLFLKGLHLCFVPRGIIRPPSPCVWSRLYANPRNYRFLLESDTICRSAAFFSFSFVRVIYREAKKEKRRKGSSREKTVCPLAHDSSAYFRLIQISLSFFSLSCMSIALLFYSNLPHSHNSPRIFARIGLCSDIRVASSSWHMEGPWTPCFPRAIPRGFSWDVPTSWPSWYFTLLMRIRSHTPARNFHPHAPLSPFTFPLLSTPTGYGFARILTRNLYGLRSYCDGIPDKIPVYLISRQTKAGIWGIPYV